MIDGRQYESLLWCLVTLLADPEIRDAADELVAEIWLQTFCHLAVDGYAELRRPVDYDSILAAVDELADQVGRPN